MILESAFVSVCTDSGLILVKDRPLRAHPSLKQEFVVRVLLLGQARIEIALLHSSPCVRFILKWVDDNNNQAQHLVIGGCASRCITLCACSADFAGCGRAGSC